MVARTMLSRDKYEYFLPENFTNLIQKVKQFLNAPEPGVVISSPYGGIIQRVEQIIQDYPDEFSGKVINVELGLNCEDLQGFEEMIKRKKCNLETDRLNILVTNADYVLRSKNSNIISELIYIHKSSKRIRLVFFFESNIYSGENFIILNQTNLYAHVYHYPLMDEFDSKRFIRYLASKWKMGKVTRKIENAIVKICGGHMWLIKHIFREYSFDSIKNIERTVTSPSTKFRLELISNSLSKEDRSVITHKGASIKSIEFLNKIGLVVKDRCTVPILYNYIKNLTKPENIILKSGDIYLGKVNLKHSFSRQEYDILKLLLSKKSTVNRDDIATKLWGEDNEDKYSIWAIEQLIRRLRNKLCDIGSDGRCIKTVRNVGYRFETKSV